MSEILIYPPSRPKKASNVYYKKPDWDIKIGDFILVHCKENMPRGTGPIQAGFNGYWLRVNQIRKKTGSYQCSFPHQENRYSCVQSQDYSFFASVFFWTTEYITKVRRDGTLIYSEPFFEPEKKSIDLPEI